jgi:hypothetical protein
VSAPDHLSGECMHVLHGDGGYPRTVACTQCGKRTARAQQKAIAAHAYEIRVDGDAVDVDGNPYATVTAAAQAAAGYPGATIHLVTV